MVSANIRSNSGTVYKVTATETKIFVKEPRRFLIFSFYSTVYAEPALIRLPIRDEYAHKEILRRMGIAVNNHEIRSTIESRDGVYDINDIMSITEPKRPNPPPPPPPMPQNECIKEWQLK